MYRHRQWHATAVKKDTREASYGELVQSRSTWCTRWVVPRLLPNRVLASRQAIQGSADRLWGDYKAIEAQVVAPIPRQRLQRLSVRHEGQTNATTRDGRTYRCLDSNLDQVVSCRYSLVKCVLVGISKVWHICKYLTKTYQSCGSISCTTMINCTS